VSAADPRTGAILAPADEAAVTSDELKACCASIYEHPFVRWLLGGELHPGGAETTRRALGLIGLAPGEGLLDVASGDGASALLAARELGCDVLGVEYGKGAVLAARAAAAAEGLGFRVGFRRGDAEALPVGDGEFDAVLCECSLCTFPDKRRAVAEIRRVLRPGGRLALCDVVVDRSRLPVELEGSLAAIACVGEALSRRGYEELLAGAGLRVTAVEPRNEDAAALAERVHDRLRGAQVLGLGRMEGSPLATDEALELVAAARGAIADGALGYAIWAAAR
jgi:SAM-dependent methyltransferase